MEPASPSAALIELTLTPETDSDRERLENALRVLTAEDPTLQATTDPGQAPPRLALWARCTSKSSSIG